jgi:ribosomal protein S18 acetylase RimI-like enzyme
LEISFRKIKSQFELEDIKSLYLTAFPPAERREFAGLVQQLNNDECIINLIFADQKIAGFVIVWDLEEFVFVEHFAVEPNLRKLGIGEWTLNAIKIQFQKTIILETELPNDEISGRRICFYERNGFHKLNLKYFQPPYDGIKPEVELILMTTKIDFTQEELDFAVNKIRKKVYRVN